MPPLCLPSVDALKEARTHRRLKAVVGAKHDLLQEIYGIYCLLLAVGDGETTRAAASVNAEGELREAKESIVPRSVDLKCAEGSKPKGVVLHDVGAR